MYLPCLSFNIGFDVIYYAQYMKIENKISSSRLIFSLLSILRIPNLNYLWIYYIIMNKY